MFNPFRSFFYGFALMLKLIFMGLTYLIGAVMLWGLLMVYFILAQHVPDTVFPFFNQSFWPSAAASTLLIAGGLSFYAGFCWSIFSGLLAVIAWAFTPEAKFVYNKTKSAYEDFTDQ